MTPIKLTKYMIPQISGGLGLPLEVHRYSSGLVLAVHNDRPDERFASLEALCDEHHLDLSECKTITDVFELPVSVLEFGTYAKGVYTPAGALHGFDPEHPEVDYATERADRLYLALGIVPDSGEQLGCLPDGRWALVQTETPGNRFAVEDVVTT